MTAIMNHMNPIPQFSPEQLDALNARFDKTHPSEIVKWAVDTFNNDVLMTSSFGADAMCTIHLATQVKPDIRILFVDTGYLFSETHDFLNQMRDRFHLNIQEYRTRNDPVVWLTVHGEPDPTVRNNVDACCAANKNEVFDRAMKEHHPAAWLRGVRADQSAERAKMHVIQWSKRNSCWAISPILHWSSRDVFSYMKTHNLPHHPLWEKGYTSIGCSPLTCTQAVGVFDETGANQRAGRWAGMNKKECGINLDA